MRYDRPGEPVWRWADKSKPIPEARFRKVIEQSPLGVHVFAPDGRSLFANEAWNEIWYSDRNGSPRGSNIFGDDQLRAAGLLFYVEQSLASASVVTTPPLRYEPAWTGRAGQPRWLRAFMHPVKDDFGIVIEMVLLLEDVTERKQVEEKLRDAEDQYRSLVEQIPAIVYIEDVEIPLTLYDSPQIERILGYPQDTYRNDPLYWEKILHPDDRERVLAGEARATERGEFKQEYRVFARDGSTVWLRDEAVLVRDEQGSPRFWRGVILDITEHKKAEEALQESEERFRTVVESLGEGLIITDADDVAVYVNPRLTELTGYAEEEILGRVAYELLLPPELWAEMCRCNGERLEEAIERYETRLRRKAGDFFWAQINAAPYRNTAGEIVGTLGVITDISERKRIEEVLRENEGRFRSLIQNASDIITILDPDGTMRYQSPAIERILGYGCDELGGRNVFDYIHPDDVREMRERFGRTVSDGGVSRPVVYRFRHYDGSWRYIESIANNLLDDPGIGGIVTNSRDITGRRLAEEALRESEGQHRRRAQELALLHRVRTTLARELDLSTVFRAVVEATVETFGYGQVSVYLVRGGSLVLQHQAGYERVLETIPLDLGVMSRVVHSGEPVLLEDASSDPHFLAAIEGIVSEVCVPLLDGGKVVGVLNVETTQAPLTEEDLRLMLALSEHVSLAMAQARLHTEAREAELRYRTLVENIPAVTYVQESGATGRLSYISPQVEEVLGYTPQEYMTAPGQWRRTIHPDDRERVLAEDRRTEETGEPFKIEYRQFARDGRVVWVRDEAVLVRGEGGQPLYWQGVKIDITDRKALEERLEHQAFHDSLTGLPNRTLFMDRLEHALARTGRRDEPVAVLFLDLDNFKFINDSLGHQGGDRVLTEVAWRLSECVRPEDTVARFGGDEFAILLEGISNPDGAVRVVERIFEVLRAPLRFNGHEVFTSTSAGIAFGVAFDAEAREEPAALLRRADLALYEAKRKGKAAYRVFGAETNDDTFERLELEGNLRRAIEHGELRVYYQPKVSLKSGRVVAFEALVRWDHPQRGLLEPERFLPIAEETGLILPIGDWVLREACRQGREWREAPGDQPPPRVCVNLSKRQFTRPNLVERVVEVLQETGLGAQGLSLEIPEDALMEDADSTMGKLRALKDLGVHLVIDHFGVAYSSLSQLKRFPLDMLELDRSLIARLGEEPEDAAIAAVMIELAHTLGWAMTAQGVETADQASRLQKLGCDLAQGFHFSEPVTAGEAFALLGATFPPG